MVEVSRQKRDDPTREVAPEKNICLALTDMLQTNVPMGYGIFYLASITVIDGG